MNLLVFPLFSQVTIADALPGCLDANINSAGTGCGGGTTIFGLTAGQFIVQNVDGAACCATGGDWNSFFEFEVINISSYTNVAISMNYSAVPENYEDEGGGPYFGCTNTPIDNSHDQIVFQYALNGGLLCNPFMCTVQRLPTSPAPGMLVALMATR
jgi:hypothetical protein